MTINLFRCGRGTFCILAISLAAGAAQAQQDSSGAVRATTLNSFGLPGLIENPTAFAMPDADLATTVSSFAGQMRGTFSFQITPRLTGSFRYSGLEGFLPGGGIPTPDFRYYDRSFDLHYALINEGDFWPAVAVGLRDFGGTGVYGSEYVVASRHFGARDQWAATLGLGWGRLGSRNGFTNPLGAIDERFETRQGFVGKGGTFNSGQWFRGDAAVFGGIEWLATDRLAFQLEYSSDAYLGEQADGVFSERSPINVGMTYGFGEGATLGIRYMYGAELGASLSFALNPKRPAVTGGRDGMPIPIAVRAESDVPYSTDWLTQESAPEISQNDISLLLAAEGIELKQLSLGEDLARVHIVNTGHNYEAQALGRVSRVLAATLPPSVERFEVVFEVEGLSASRVVLRRSDLEQLEHHPDGTSLSYGRAIITDAARLEDAGLREVSVEHPLFDWELGPFFDTSLFDPDDPFRYSTGLEIQARYEFAPGLVLSGSARADLLGNIGDSTRISDSILPHVRSDANIYDREGKYSLRHLTFESFSRPGANLYSRLSAGYLEEMYAGVSGELLWQPVDGRLGLGIELNHVWQRDFDQRFGLQDYSITTGHLSAYYDLRNGYDLQVDVGRYLAGDWGATLSLDRTFDNGWSVGAFATFTDVSWEDFGEGSFDKGITLTIPLSWFTGKATRTEQEALIRPILRDGGARLDVRNRLHDLIQDYHNPGLAGSWGRFWR